MVLAIAPLVVVVVVGLLLALTPVQRRARLVERLAIQAAVQIDLDRQVAERTADPTRADDDLHRMQADAGTLAQASPARCSARPRPAAPASTVAMPSFSRNTARMASADRPAATQLIDPGTGNSIVRGP